MKGRDDDWSAPRWSGRMSSWDDEPGGGDRGRRRGGRGGRNGERRDGHRHGDRRRQRDPELEELERLSRSWDEADDDEAGDWPPGRLSLKRDDPA